MDSVVSEYHLRVLGQLNICLKLRRKEQMALKLKIPDFGH
jgi:hypothetical protein